MFIRANASEIRKRIFLNVVNLQLSKHFERLECLVTTESSELYERELQALNIDVGNCGDLKVNLASQLNFKLNRKRQLSILRLEKNPYILSFFQCNLSILHNLEKFRK